MKKRIINVSAVTPQDTQSKDIIINADGRIEALVAPLSNHDGETTTIDGKGMIAYPGMIDLLTHGYGNHLYNDAQPNAIPENSTEILKHGVTSFAPSILSNELSKHLKALSTLSKNMASNGARVLGIHSEGPCFASPGAHNPDNLTLPSESLANDMIEAANGQLKFVTMAPELPGAKEFAKIFTDAGVSIHLGHSNALPEQVPSFVEMGINACTHIYDVFPQATNPGTGVTAVSLIDALFAEDSIGIGMICDGIHVHPTHVKLLTQLPKHRLFLETDSVKFSGHGAGRFEIYPGEWITITENDAPRMEDGGLAGSALTSDRALQNLIKFTGISLSHASYATSLNPARLAGQLDDIGSIEIGKFADIILLDPTSLDVQTTFIAGQEKHTIKPLETQTC